MYSDSANRMAISGYTMIDVTFTTTFSPARITPVRPVSRMPVRIGREMLPMPSWFSRNELTMLVTPVA